MCLLFLYINNDEASGKYSMILANNRDEYWARPTATAEMKGDKYKWMGGRDLEPGREGGTWLGISETGKVAILLNILCKQYADKRGRGFEKFWEISVDRSFKHNGNLVKDFLESEISGEEYITEVSQAADLYNTFHLILVDLRKSPSSFHYVNSTTGDVSFNYPGIFSCDNSKDLITQWKKTMYGQDRFTSIVQEGMEESVMIDNLFDLLADKTHTNLPDPQMHKQFTDVGYDTGSRMEERSCVNVFSPEIQYGTRTSSVILVNHQGECTYIEKTLDTQTNTWTTKQEHFSFSRS